jgi:hypothetical protein
METNERTKKIVYTLKRESVKQISYNSMHFDETKESVFRENKD